MKGKKQPSAPTHHSQVETIESLLPKLFASIKERDSFGESDQDKEPVQRMKLALPLAHQYTAAAYRE